MNAEPSRRQLFAEWAAAGLAAGVVGGFADALTAIIRRVGGLGPEKAVRLIIVATGVLAAVGLIVGAVVGGAALVAAWANRHGARSSGRSRLDFGGLLAVVASAPLLIYDARIIFAGRKAASIPGNRYISFAIVALGLAAVYLLARGYRRLLTSAGATAGLTRASAALLFVLAAGIHVANVTVLPRLYPWFHATLSVVTFVALLLAARLLAAWRLGRQRPVSRRRLLGAAAVVAVLASFSLWQLRGSQTLRFAAYERTALVGLALRASPLPLAPKTVAAAERDDAEQSLPPLPDGPRRPEDNVVVITIDALRADHVGAYGYKRQTTPNIDALTARSTRFARAYAQAPHTSFSVASMLTGKYFPTLARLAPGEIHEPVATVLRKYGWRTAAFYPPAVFFVDAHKLKAYADTHFGFEYVKFEYLNAEGRVDQIISYYETVKPTKALVWAHFFEPHEPYEVHPKFRFGTGDIDRYDSEIAYVDGAVGRLLEYLRKKRPGTIIVVSADHGEEFDEHGGRYHGSTLYDEQIRIPLVISVPEVAPHVIEHAVELIDVTPTVLNLLDIPVPARMRGTDLGPWLASPPAHADRLPPAFAEVEDKRMVVWRNEKLICDLNWGFCAYYDLATDPGERHNLADVHPDRAAAMRGILDRWLDGHVRLEPLLSKGSSNPAGGPVPKAIERGRLGDLLAASDLGALMVSNAAVGLRREAAELLVALPARKETAPALATAASDPDPVIANWAAVGAVRLGDNAAKERVRAVLADAGAARMLRIRAGLAMAAVGDLTGVPVLGQALDQCEDILLCRLIILNLGRLRDPRAVPALLKHLPEVQNRREMVDALGDIGDLRARDALLERLASDEYVPVRVQSARALAKLKAVSAIAALEKAARTDTEPTVVAAAREALLSLQQLYQ